VEEVEVEGRRMRVNRAARGVAWFTFDELCKQAVGAGEYIGISKQYHTVVVSGIPRMNLDHRDHARRFILLVDELYNHKVKLICTAEGTPQELFSVQEGEHAKDEQQHLFDEVTGRHMGTIWIGEEEKFMFQRTVSRLQEMQTEQYLQTPHKKF